MLEAGPRAAERGRARWWTFALVVYVPLLFIDRGKVASDTKSYLYLDPSRLLARATSMWDPHIGLGTTSHQNIGYLFPMGPYYWFMENALHVPAWIAQRLWLGTLLFGAGMGIRYLLRTLRIDGPGVPVAMLAYAFTPYVLEYSARLSVLLGPWAALPWFVAFAARAVQKRGWRYPALFALTVQLVGGVNATALVYALVGPAVFVLYAVLVTHESDWRRVWSATWRTALLTLVTSFWWLSGLWVEGRYGLNVLRFTEKIRDVSATSYPIEVVRGLGYWMLYGRDPVGFWNHALVDFTARPFVIFVSLLIPSLAIFAGSTIRWRYRLFFVLLIVIGVATAVGAAPYNNPSLAGAAFKSFAATSTLGLALRSTSRATPLVVLGFAALLAAGVNAFAERMRAANRPRIGTGAAYLIGALCLINAVGAWNGTYYTPYLERGAIPAYWNRALKAADARPHDTRLLSLPGADFAAYRWGDTVDPIEPGLIDRPFVARELVPFGSAAGANLLQALDRRLQENVLAPDAVAPIARLMAVGDVLLRLDLETNRFHLVPASDQWRLFTDGHPSGLRAPQRYGRRVAGRRVPPDIGDLTTPTNPDTPPPPVAILAVEDPQSIVRTRGADAPVVVAGDGEGLVDLAAAGLLDTRRLILYAGSYASKPADLRALPDDAVLVLTDSNRRRAQRTGLANAYGYTETAGEKPLVNDPSDQRLEVFPGATDASKTVDNIHGGVKSVQATSYGSIFGFTPSKRPAAAFDGNPKTTWQIASFSGQRMVVQLEHPITTDHISFVQPTADNPALFVNQISLRFDEGAPVRRSLDRSSETHAGQTVRFPRQRFSTIEISIDSLHRPRRLKLTAANPVGFAEIRLADDAPGARPVRAVENMRLPTDLLDALGTASDAHPLVIAMSSESTMDRAAMRREFTVPTDRSFSISGHVVLSAFADEAAIDRALGLPDAEHGGITATSDSRLDDPRARASNALDGDPTTSWNTELGKVRGVGMHVTLPKPTTIDHLDLQLTSDGRHSTAKQLRITGDDGSRTVNLPDTTVFEDRGINTASVAFAPLHTRTLGVTITKSEPLVSEGLVVLPVGIAELGIPGVQRAPVPATLPDNCLSGLFTIDGHAMSVRVRGSTDDALGHRPLDISPCGSTDTVALTPGAHRVVAQRERDATDNQTAFDVQQLVLASGPGGAAAGATSLMTMPPSDLGPTVSVQRQNATKLTLQVAAASKPYWLVLGESVNDGWRAKIDGRDLGRPRLVDGYANGWLIPAGVAGQAVTVHLEWVPQRVVSIALLLSLLGGVLCLALIVVTGVRRRGEETATDYEPSSARTLLLEPPLTRNRARTVAAVGIVTIAAGVLVNPWIGLLVGALALWSVFDRRGRLVVRYAPAAIFAGITVYVAGSQLVRHYVAGSEWPANFAAARIPTWIGLFLLLTDAVVSRMWHTDDGPPSPERAVKQREIGAR